MEAVSVSNIIPATSVSRVQIKSAPARLLVMCSDPDLDVLKEVMAEEPWHLEHAESAADASELMRTISFDAALIDPNLPDHKDLYWLPSAGIPIILISNPGEGQEFLSTFAPQAADFIFKPFCAPELIAMSTCNFRSQTPKRLALCINNVPIALNFCWLCTKCFHRYLSLAIKGSIKEREFY